MIVWCPRQGMIDKIEQYGLNYKYVEPHPLDLVSC